MYILNKLDLEKIKKYKNGRKEEIAYYFFEKFKDDVLTITFNKMKVRYNSFPLEKGDLVSLIWKSVQKTLETFKTNHNFYANLLNNSYQIVSKEILKFYNNKEMIMTKSFSYEKYEQNYKLNSNVNNINFIKRPKSSIINEIVLIVCEYVKKYDQKIIKKILYLKSCGYSIKEISLKTRKNRYFIKTLLNKIEYIVKKYYL